MENAPGSTNACPAAACRELEGGLDALLAREWLLTNGQGGFAAGTVIGCPTRKYHGWLVGSRRPPLERFLLLAGASDRVRSGDEWIELSTWEFNHGPEPAGYAGLTRFEYSIASPDPWVRWTYVVRGIEVCRTLTLITGRPMIRVRYDVIAPAGGRIALEVSPMLAMRDFHGLRRQAAADTWDIESDGSWLWVRDHREPGLTLAMFPLSGPGLANPHFHVQSIWWHNIRYRVEARREYLFGEDLQLAGTFRASGAGTLSLELAAVGFAANPDEARQAVEPAVRSGAAGRGAPRSAGRAEPTPHDLEAAGDQFIVRRAGAEERVTIIAGYPWFGDWGRDAFISLEGLLLRSGRFAEARQVLETFASVQRNGLIPNRFDDYGGECDYNSVDASLWYVHAADAYLSASGDDMAWHSFLSAACRRVVESFVAGTEFDIGVDGNGLVRCGNPRVQITWMDAKWGDTVYTPRHGKPVEVNALWYHALRLLEKRFAADDAEFARECRELADRVEQNFEGTFWNESAGCLYDCVRDDEKDGAIRPNQIFAVSLAHSPLSAPKQAAVLEKVREHLLTPFGLRSLAPSDPNYIGVYGGVRPVRDRAYHNGTVWSWLIGPYVEAYLRVHGFSSSAKDEARALLRPLLDHVGETCLGTISEIFDGDRPHTPRGCVAQAWSVAEVLRVGEMVGVR